MIDIKQFDNFGKDVNDVRFKTQSSDQNDLDDKIENFFVDDKEEDEEANPKKQFIQQLGSDFDVYKKAVEEYMALLQKPVAAKTYKPKMVDFSSQTDFVYQNFKKRTNVVFDNAKQIGFQEREAKIMLKLNEGQRECPYIFNCFQNKPTTDFTCPNIFNQSQTCMQFTPHFDFHRLGQMGFQKPAINYLFSSVTNKVNDQHVKNQTKSVIQTIKEERNSMIIIYGDKGTSKKWLKNLIITNIFEFFQHEFIKGLGEKDELKLTVIVREFEVKFSELWLKQTGYEEQIEQQVNALFPKIEQKSLKEQVSGQPTKSVFIELSKITEKWESDNLAFLETATDKICGVYIITDNELVKWPKKKKDKTKTEFIKHLLDDAAVGTKGTPVYRPLKNLLKAWKTIPINVIVALNPEALASRRVYETILSQPDQNIVCENGIYEQLNYEEDCCNIQSYKQNKGANALKGEGNTKSKIESSQLVKKSVDTNRRSITGTAQGGQVTKKTTTLVSTSKTSTSKISTREVSKTTVVTKKSSQTVSGNKKPGFLQNTIAEEVKSEKTIQSVEDEISKLQKSLDKMSGVGSKTTYNEDNIVKKDKNGFKKTVTTSSNKVSTKKPTALGGLFGK